MSELREYWISQTIVEEENLSMKKRNKGFANESKLRMMENPDKWTNYKRNGVHTWRLSFN